jgi:hypothetical protein
MRVEVIDPVAEYAALMETGLSKNFHEMFAPFGLDPEKPEFWEGGLALIGKYMNDLIHDKDKKFTPRALAEMPKALEAASDFPSVPLPPPQPPAPGL